jgi:hypothetical protein
MTEQTTVHDAVADTRERVHDAMAEFVGEHAVTELPSGDVAVRYGSAQVTVTVRRFDEDSSLVVLDAPLVSGIAPSAELYEYVATATPEQGLGHLGLAIATDGTATIHFRHTLLGEYLEPAELRLSVVAIALLGDRMDDALAERFGGSTFYPTND